MGDPFLVMFTMLEVSFFVCLIAAMVAFTARVMVDIFTGDF